MTEKPITYESPKLTRDGSYLQSDEPFICIPILEEMLEEFPDASEYYIEASTKQWSDDSGCEIWVRCDQWGVWTWSLTKRHQRLDLCFPVVNALEYSGIAKQQPVQIYFRLTYYD